jgi:hypothetical protein
VLPSVERETVDLTSPRRTVNGQPLDYGLRPVSGGYADMQSPKRKGLPSFPEDDEAFSRHAIKRPRPVYHENEWDHSVEPMKLSRPAREGDYHMEPRARHPQQPVIDLTYSPRRQPTNGDVGYYASAHTHASAGPSNLSYIPVPSRRSPMREVRATRYEVHTGERPRVVPNSGMYERRAPPVNDYIPVADGRHQRPVHEEGVRYLRSGQPYGGQHFQ